MRQIISIDRRQRFWEFFIFGCVFTMLFIFWLIVRAGLTIGFLTGVLAGICFTAAWYHMFRRFRAQITSPLGQEKDAEIVFVTHTVPGYPEIIEDKPSEPAIETTPAEEFVQKPDDDDDDDEEIASASASQVAALVASITEGTEKPYIEAYCVKCRVKRAMENPKLVRLKNGRPALSARCAVCNTRLYRIISAKQNKDWMSSNEEAESRELIKH